MTMEEQHQEIAADLPSQPVPPRHAPRRDWSTAIDQVPQRARRQLGIPAITCPSCECPTCAHWPDGVPAQFQHAEPYHAHHIGPQDELPPTIVWPLHGTGEKPIRVARMEYGEVVVEFCEQKPRRRARSKQVTLRPPISSTRPLSLGTRKPSKRSIRETDRLIRKLRRAGAYDDKPKFGVSMFPDACPPSREPCPFVSCRHHLYLEVDEETGAVKINFPGRDPDEIGETCSLRVANEGSAPDGNQGEGHTHKEIGLRLNLVPEVVRTILIPAMQHLNEGLDLRRGLGVDEAEDIDHDTDSESGDGGGDVDPAAVWLAGLHDDAKLVRNLDAALGITTEGTDDDAGDGGGGGEGSDE